MPGEHLEMGWYIVSVQYMLVISIIFIIRKRNPYSLARAGMHPWTLTDQPLSF